jgi:hypothetical protein
LNQEVTAWRDSIPDADDRSGHLVLTTSGPAQIIHRGADRWSDACSLAIADLRDDPI